MFFLLQLTRYIPPSPFVSICLLQIQLSLKIQQGKGKQWFFFFEKFPLIPLSKLIYDLKYHFSLHSVLLNVLKCPPPPPTLSLPLPFPLPFSRWFTRGLLMQGRVAVTCSNDKIMKCTRGDVSWGHVGTTTICCFSPWEDMWLQHAPSPLEQFVILLLLSPLFPGSLTLCPQEREERNALGTGLCCCISRVNWHRKKGVLFLHLCFHVTSSIVSKVKS